MASIEKKLPNEMLWKVLEGIENYDDLHAFVTASPKAAAVFASAYPAERFRVIRDVISSVLHPFGLETALRIYDLNKSTSEEHFAHVIRRTKFTDELDRRRKLQFPREISFSYTNNNMTEHVRNLNDDQLQFLWDLCNRYRVIVDTFLDSTQPDLRVGRNTWAFPWNLLSNHASFNYYPANINPADHHSSCKGSRAELRPLLYAGFFSLELFIRARGLSETACRPTTTGWKHIFGLVPHYQLDIVTSCMEVDWKDASEEGEVAAYERHVTRTTAIGLVAGFLKRMGPPGFLKRMDRPSLKTPKRFAEQLPAVKAKHRFPEDLRHLPGLMMPHLPDMLSRYPARDRYRLRKLCTKHPRHAFLLIIKKWCKLQSQLRKIEARPLALYLKETFDDKYNGGPGRKPNKMQSRSHGSARCRQTARKSTGGYTGGWPIREESSLSAEEQKMLRGGLKALWRANDEVIQKEAASGGSESDGGMGPWSLFVLPPISGLNNSVASS